MSATGRQFVGTYAVAVLSPLAALGVTALLVKPLAGPFFMFQFAAVVGAALHGGLGPGLLATGLSCAGFYAAFFAPTLQSHEAYRLASLALVSVILVWLAARLRTARAVEATARLHLANEKMEAEGARAKAEAAEAEARSIGAQQERLIAVVSHDLRNPLNAISLTAEHLRDWAGPRSSRRGACPAS